MAKILEIEFKGGRKAFFSNPLEFPFVVGDMVVVQAEKGEDLGSVVNMGSLVDKRAGEGEFLQIIRKPSHDDVEKWEENQQLERDAFHDCRRRIEEHGLEMKLVDVEYQFDRNKITFYFTSDNRVDFRALVRDLAGRYRTRIELRQIGVRDEARRIGGVGVCGKRLWTFPKPQTRLTDSRTRGRFPRFFILWVVSHSESVIYLATITIPHPC